MKGQSNLVIAGFPRNSFRASLVRSLVEVEHRIDYSVMTSQGNLTELRMPLGYSTGVSGPRTSPDRERGTAQIIC